MAAERIDRGYLGTPLRLTLLTPEIVQGILDGRQPDGLTLPRLMEPSSVEPVLPSSSREGRPYRGLFAPAPSSACPTRADVGLTVLRRP